MYEVKRVINKLTGEIEVVANVSTLQQALDSLRKHRVDSPKDIFFLNKPQVETLQEA